MGLLDKLIGKGKKEEPPKSENTLEQDIIAAAEWVANALNVSGYKADYTLESMKEVDRFFDEQNTPTGILSKNRGQILFSLGSYVGQTIIKLHGGSWITDDNDPQGEINAAVKLNDGTVMCPMIRCMKRYTEGAEEGIWAYVYVLDKK